ncbi:MAG: YgjV family protein [Clostridia bacterium]|nr:YgjV family protein [Clostridia bacterium]
MLGHIIGVIAIGLYFLSYQIFDKKKLLFVQTLATAMMCLQYILIGAYSGFGLNIVCIIRNLLFYHRDKKALSGVWLPVLLAVVMAVVSLFSWDGYHSLLIILGLMINTVCMGICDSQNLRKSVLLTCPMIMIYNVFAHSYSGIISETISLISAAIGIVRYKKSEPTAEG